MPNLVTPQSRITRDKENDAIRTWFDLTVESAVKTQFVPRDLAYQILKYNSQLFLWKTGLWIFMTIILILVKTPIG